MSHRFDPLRTPVHDAPRRRLSWRVGALLLLVFASVGVRSDAHADPGSQSIQGCCAFQCNVSRKGRELAECIQDCLRGIPGTVGGDIRGFCEILLPD